MMNNHVQANVVQFYSNLETFRIAEKYTDLTIECDDRYFRCHRLTLASASKFFDSMFADTFKERKEEQLLIREVDAMTLGEVLKFIYTGDVAVTNANVCDLFKASKLFVLTGIANLCLEFIRNNRMTVNTTLEMYSLACRDKNETIIDTLSQDIIDQFKIFARASMFLEISFNDFKIILDKLSSSSMENEEAFLGAIFRWLFHCRKERSSHFGQLYSAINFGSISSEVTKFVTSELYKDQDAAELSFESDVDPVGYNEFTAMPRMPLSTLPEKKLHLFFRFFGENSTKIFSIDEHGGGDISGEIHHSKNVPQSFRTIALDNYLYCLHYVRRISEEEKKQKFRVYTAVDQRTSVELNAPPVIFGDVSLCRGRNNNIYAYNHTIHQPLVKTGSRCSAMFTDEELDRGIYLYNADLDVWLPVPAMLRKVEDACMTNHNGLLYLIGNGGPADTLLTKTMQTYDYREGKWRISPSNTRYDRVGAECCVFNGKIYVCGGRYQPQVVETYDPTKGSWEILDEEMVVKMEYHRLISFNSKLWAVGGGTSLGTTSDGNYFSIQNYPNKVSSTVKCNGCTSSTYYYNGHNRNRLSVMKHHEHSITSTSENNWVDTTESFQDLKLSKFDAILDAIVF